jgi:site-specific DNA-cytosine methylase
MPRHQNLFEDEDVVRAAQFLTERELMRALGLSRTTLWRLRGAGLPTLAVGRRIRYDLDKVRTWLAADGQRGGGSSPATLPVRAHAEDGLAECHWSLAVALDPKHRPQEPTRPSSTARREWWRYPQEAHLLDRSGGRYRRLVASEVAAIQGFPEGWGRRAVQDELLLLRGYGDAVPPPLSEVLFSELPSLLGAMPETGVEICAGFGGLALGEKRALNVRHLALLERWDVACEVLRQSGAFDPSCVRELDLREVDWSEFTSRADLLSGGPPCQPWSQAGLGLGAEDERDLLGTTPSIVGQVKPLGFVFENVPGLLSGENEPYARELVRRLRDADGPYSYGVAMAVFNAADFGIAQTRRRVFIVGVRGGTVGAVHEFFDRVAARRTHSHPRTAAALGLQPWRRIADVVTDWSKSKARWHRWPASAVGVEEEKMAGAESGSQAQVAATKPTRPRIGLEWPSRGQKIVWRDGTWAVSGEADATTGALALPLLPSPEAGGDPAGDPWLVLGDPCPALDALRRQLGRDVRLAYVDLPRIRTNAGTFDAADRERVLDTWLSLARAVLRRAIALLEDRGAIAVLCGIDETSYARLLLDELAGPQNHLGTVAWQKGYSPRNMPNMRELSPVHDNILLYARRIEALPPVSLRLPAKGFSNPDGDPRRAWKAEQKGANKPDCDYEVRICPYRWELASGELPPGIWRISPKTGVIWGQPECTGRWRFVARVTDRTGATAERELEIEVADDAPPPPPAHVPWLIVGSERAGDGPPAEGGPLHVLTETMPRGRRGSVYSACIAAAGGSPWLGTTRPGKTSASGKGRYWEFPASTLIARTAEDSVDFKSKDDAIPALKVYADGEDQRLNQTTIWFGRLRKGAADEVGDLTEVDYSQDAKKELEALAAQGIISAVVATSKPVKLMARLLALFSGDGSTVVDIGSPAAEMAAVATAAGRRAVYVALPPDEQLFERLWLPRLRLASRGEHSLPQGIIFSGNRRETGAGYVVEGLPRPNRPEGGVFVVRPGTLFAEVDNQLGTISIDYGRYPAGSAAFLAALASVEGLVPDARGRTRPFAHSRDGRSLGVYIHSEDWVERSTIEDIEREFSAHIDSGGRVRIYYHRGPADPDRIGDHRVEMRRIPFALLLAASVT